MVNNPSELSTKEKVFRLMGMITSGKVKLPINFGLRNHETGHSGVIRSLEDVKISGGEIRLRCEDGEVVVTDSHEFKVHFDGAGKAIFFSDI